MTREEWEDVLYASVTDEVIQDQLNDYVLSLEAENAELRELVRDMRAIIWAYDEYTSDDGYPPALPLIEDRLRELGVDA